MYSPIFPLTSVLGIYFKEIRRQAWKDVYTRHLFVTASLILSNIWKQVKYISIIIEIKYIFKIYIKLYSSLCIQVEVQYYNK